MFRVFLIFLFLLLSCGYPDIDTVPDFKDVNITEKEAIDLCEMNNSDNEQINKCLLKINRTSDQ